MKNSAAKARPFWRNRRLWASLAALFFVVLLAHWIWQPGVKLRYSGDNLNRNALWIGHGWLGADSWFTTDAEKSRFRDSRSIDKLASLCRENGVRDLYPHLTPTQPDGAVAAYDDAQIERFLDQTKGLRVLPWIGGRMGQHIAPDDAATVGRFVASVGELMRKHPRLAGVHLNVEPWKSGDAGMLKLLDDLRAVLPARKILSISGYPPQSVFFPFRLAWSRDYYQQVASRVDQIAVMLYDTSIHDGKMYQYFVARSTNKVLDWTHNSGAKILVGVPTYGAAGPKLGPLYHNPRVENLSNSLAGLRRALSDQRAAPGNYLTLPRNYQGAAIYCEWETDAADWEIWRRDFPRSP